MGAQSRHDVGDSVAEQLVTYRGEFPGTAKQSRGVGWQQQDFFRNTDGLKRLLDRVAKVILSERRVCRTVGVVDGHSKLEMKKDAGRGPWRCPTAENEGQHSDCDAFCPVDGVGMAISDTPMSVADIEKRIPHRPPMRLLDEIVSEEDQKIVCRKTFSEEDFFVQGHFPKYPLVPGVIQCECCLQAGAILLQKFTPEGEDVVPVATRMDRVKFKNMVRPGDTVEVEVTLREQLGNAFFLTGKMTCGGKLTTRLEFACSVTKPREADGE